ncbi:60S acidic ribosomal protein P3-like [Amaranthus tricolor]|uniref:60S acidic ribosomal protein P3-like n=1 Tax=Amaranthus tricolor TaxID=29722 RepID=UPI002582D199|nr:60S acidic ribosomal protein P3-like [Amaranthus tricolor]
MGVYTFVCKKSGDEWTAKQYSGDLEASADCTFSLQRKLVQTALSSGDSGSIQSSFSYITPSSAVAQVIIGGAVAAAYVGGGAAAADLAGGAAAAEPAKEEKKPEKEESEDEDMGFSLFD